MTVKRRATYEDLLKVPDSMVAEIVDGELYASPRPAPRHSVAASVLVTNLNGPFQQGKGGPGGWWILMEPELHMADDVLVPDIAGWKREHLPQIPDVAYFTIPPQWICEVVSPSTAKLDRTKKLAIYARERVAHAWLVDPLQRTQEILRRDGDRWVAVATHRDAETVRAEPFDEVAIELPAVWGESLGPDRVERG
jgi:Uma2 family endonuclease